MRLPHARPAYCVIRGHHTRAQHLATCRPVIDDRYQPAEPDKYRALRRYLAAH